MVVEVRSDGQRVVTRGALEDLETGTTQAVEAHADSIVEMPKVLAQVTMAALKRSVLASLASESRGSRWRSPLALRKRLAAALGAGEPDPRE